MKLVPERPRIVASSAHGSTGCDPVAKTHKLTDKIIGSRIKFKTKHTNEGVQSTNKQTTICVIYLYILDRPSTDKHVGLTSGGGSFNDARMDDRPGMGIVGLDEFVPDFILEKS